MGLHSKLRCKPAASFLLDLMLRGRWLYRVTLPTKPQTTLDYWDGPGLVRSAEI